MPIITQQEHFAPPRFFQWSCNVSSYFDFYSLRAAGLIKSEVTVEPVGRPFVDGVKGFGPYQVKAN